MAKQTKKTKDVLFDEILAEYNDTSLGKCDVLGFSFPSVSSQHKFHFSLMAAKVRYYLYDGCDETAIIVLAKSAEDSERIKELSAKCGGIEYKPNLKQ